MMFGKNKKTDSKIRWQSPQFKNSLKAQRNYRRPARYLTSSGNKTLFSYAEGLSLKTKIVFSVFFFGLVYLFYVPNFLFVKYININGLDDETSASARSTTQEYLAAKLPFPRQNFLFLSPSGLKNYLLENNKRILQVVKITKRWPNSLNLQLEPRTNKFVLTDPVSAYILSADGLVTGKFYLSPSTTLPNLGILIKLTSEAALSLNQSALNSQVTNFVSYLSNYLPKAAGDDINYFQMSAQDGPDVSVFMKGGQKIIFNMGKDKEKTLLRLATLINQLPQNQKQKLFYIDMRSGDKAYVCNKGQPCVKDLALPTGSASSTPIN